MPIPAVAGQPRGLNRDHSANSPFANGGEQLLEPGTRGATTRATEIVVDYDRLAPAQLPRTVGQAVLAALALAVVDNLVGRRLANVDDGLASKVLRRDLAHRCPPGSRCVPRLRCRRALRSEAPLRAPAFADGLRLECCCMSEGSRTDPPDDVMRPP